MKKILLFLLFFLFVLILSGCQKRSPVKISNEIQVSPSPSLPEDSPTTQVPLPSGEAIINYFFSYLSEGKIPEAVGMLSVGANPDETSKQAWGISLNSFKRVNLKSVDVWEKSNWDDNRQIYKVIFDLQLKDNSQNIGWDEGQNTRWIELTRDSPSSLWKINTLGTGP